MSLINCEINNFLTWSKECIIVTSRAYSNKKPKFAITDKKLYVPVVSVEHNEKLLQELKIGFKGTINWKNINESQHYRHETNI